MNKIKKVLTEQEKNVSKSTSIGRANINGKDTGIKVIISLHRNDNNYYYISVMDLKII